MNETNNPDGKIHETGKWGIPAAFYRNDTPPPPPASDPHYVEFETRKEFDTLPDWLLMAMPVVVLLVALLHGAVAVILLWLLH